MRLLFLTTRLPYPPLGGERVRPFYFLKYFPRDWKITLLSFLEHQKERAVLEEYRQENICVRTVLLPRMESYGKCFMGLLGKKPLQVSYYSSQRMERLIAEEMRGVDYDCAFAHLLRMGHYLYRYKSIAKVLDLSDALTLRYQMSSALRSVQSKTIEGIESRRLAWYEPWIAQQFDASLVASRIDKQFLEEKLGTQRLEVVENGVEEADGIVHSVQGNPKKIVFFGNMRTFHNADAARYFYQEIFPLVRKSVPDAQFVIVGASISGSLKMLVRDPSVRIFADVENIRSYVEDACVSVAPMRVAVGIQNKILQSMAYRVPVVTTTLGLGGIRAKPGEHILVADNPADFAASVVRCVQDSVFRMKIVDAAHLLVREEYVWPKVTAGLVQILVRVVSQKNV